MERHYFEVKDKEKKYSLVASERRSSSVEMISNSFTIFYEGAGYFGDAYLDNHTVRNIPKHLAEQVLEKLNAIVIVSKSKIKK
jgi:hypothetical protein